MRPTSVAPASTDELAGSSKLPDQIPRPYLLPRHDQLSCSIHKTELIPQQHASHVAVLQIIDPALAELLVPVLDDLQAAIDLADRFITKVEQVGIEKREMPIGLVPAGHIVPGRAAHT